MPPSAKNLCLQPRFQSVKTAVTQSINTSTCSSAQTREISAVLRWELAGVSEISLNSDGRRAAARDVNHDAEAGEQQTPHPPPIADQRRAAPNPARDHRPSGSTNPPLSAAARTGSVPVAWPASGAMMPTAQRHSLSSSAFEFRAYSGR
uniref:Uncharacterized protein n=1 Tax=Plectus sambesii TaxID=2011161 RepID=A0A914W286_9BILA